MARVLLVEDEPLWLATTAARLGEAGYDVVEAKDADSARKLFAEREPAAVVLDINLPDGDGVELLEEFKDKKPDLVAVMLTGYATIDKAMQARALGGFDVLEKMGGDYEDQDLAAELIERLQEALGA